MKPPMQFYYQELQSGLDSLHALWFGLFYEVDNLFVRYQNNSWGKNFTNIQYLIIIGQQPFF